MITLEEKLEAWAEHYLLVAKLVRFTVPDMSREELDSINAAAVAICRVPEMQLMNSEGKRLLLFSLLRTSPAPDVLQ